MPKNMGTVDRTIRVIIALLIAAAYFTGRISGTLAIVLGVFAIVFLLTSIVGWCPSYMPFRISTRKPPAGPTPAA
jgi:K+-transporting ATPase A subunit